MENVTLIFARHLAKELDAIIRIKCESSKAESIFKRQQTVLGAQLAEEDLTNRP